MKKTNSVVLLMAVFVVSCLAGCVTEPYTTGENSSWQGGISEPQEMVMVPGSQVYFVPQSDADVFYYNNSWWSSRGNRWYRSNNYNGPWGIVEQRYVPAPVYQVPNDYRARYEKQQRIPYGQWKKQWKDNKKDNKKKDK